MPSITSKLKIVNKALIRLGVRQILDLTESNKRARVMGDLYDDTLEAVLRAHDWNFARKRKKLSLTTTDSDHWGLTYAFTLPADYLIARRSEEKKPFKVENNLIFCDDNVLNIVYTAKVTSPGAFDPNFVDCFSAKLAYESCESILKDENKTAVLFGIYDGLLRDARGIDSTEGTPEDVDETGGWIESRI